MEAKGDHAMFECQTRVNRQSDYDEWCYRQTALVMVDNHWRSAHDDWNSPYLDRVIDRNVPRKLTETTQC